VKKLIAVICEYILIPDRIGGMDRFFKAYDSALKEKGYSITWFFKDVKKFDFYKDLTIVNAQNNDIESFFLEYSKKNKNKYDIVITHFLTPISSFYKRVKIITNGAHIITVDHNSRPINGFSLKKRLKNRVKGIFYGKYVDKIIGVSEYTKRHVINDFGCVVKNKIEVIYNGIDVKRYEKQTMKRVDLQLKLIVVSYLRESKGIQDLFAALAKMDVEMRDRVNVDIYGVGYYKNTLIGLSKVLNLESTVHFKGNSSKLYKTYHNYHYMVLPTYMECFNLAILESLASNVPVITTNVGGNLEVVKDNQNGYIFNPKDIDALHLIIETILKGEKTISKNVNLKIEKEFTLQKMVANHLKLVTCI